MGENECLHTARDVFNWFRIYEMTKMYSKPVIDISRIVKIFILIDTFLHLLT